MRLPKSLVEEHINWIPKNEVVASSLVADLVKDRIRSLPENHSTETDARREELIALMEDLEIHTAQKSFTFRP